MRFREIIEGQPDNVKPSSGVIKPKAPLTPSQARKWSEKQSTIQRQIADASAAYAERIRDLRAKLARRP
jgi:hypothetical protein